MADDWRDHWDRLLALQERIEQHATGRRGSPIDASADFASFVVESENLRDGVKRTLSGSAKAVDSAMRSATSLQLAHDLAIKVKHQVQSRKPWSTAEDAGYDVKLSKGVPDSPSPFERRARSTTLPGTPPFACTRAHSVGRSMGDSVHPKRDANPHGRWSPVLPRRRR
jgi:hypothetical protein